MKVQTDYECSKIWLNQKNLPAKSDNGFKNQKTTSVTQNCFDKQLIKLVDHNKSHFSKEVQNSRYIKVCEDRNIIMQHQNQLEENFQAREKQQNLIGNEQVLFRSCPRPTKNKNTIVFDFCHINMVQQDKK